MLRITIALALALGCGTGGTATSDAPADAAADATDGPPPGIVPAGTFGMGCPDSQLSECAPDELPYHMVTVSAFAVDLTEVTQAGYQECIAAGACTAPQANFDPSATPNRPVRDVSWLQAQAYCAWRGMRLPTEAEWEKAARGTDQRRFPWGDTPPDCTRAELAGCHGAPQDVGGRESGAGPYGTLDSAGNLAEWVLDWYDASYYSQSPATDPQGPDAGAMRVARGGSYLSDTSGLRVSRRVVGNPTAAYDGYGFRCVRPLQ